jgi:hypothetical protein
MTGGIRTSARERAGRGCGWAALLGRAGAGASMRAGRAVGPSRRKEGKRPNRQFLFFFFKNMNSSGICLFH